MLMLVEYFKKQKYIIYELPKEISYSRKLRTSKKKLKSVL